MTSLLYTRRGCHLCDRAEDLLAGRPAGLVVRDVDADPAWQARYGLRVPVLEVDDVVVLEGHFTGPEVERVLAAVTGPG